MKSQREGVPTTITICVTCKRAGADSAEGAAPDGEALAALVEAAARGRAKVATRRHACLMGCQGGCNVAIQAPGKLTYVLGRFEPSGEAAEGIVAYAEAHAESESGQVPFRQWPQAVKGHFVARIPALPEA